MLVVYNKSSFGIDIDNTHISPKESKEFKHIKDISKLTFLELRGAIVVNRISEDLKPNVSNKSNEKKPTKKSTKDTINYINDVKEDDVPEHIEDNKILENLGDEE